MKIAIINCFHWIGYHLVEVILEEGIEVFGIYASDTEQSDFLSMFVKRNSLFTKAEKPPEKADYTVVIGHTSNISSCSCIIQLSEGNIEPNENSFYDVRIQLPLLFGEWMPMDEKGIYVLNKYISFSSEDFMKKGIYVRDYMNGILAVMKEKSAASSNKTSIVVEELILENDSHFRDNSTKRKIIERLQRHFRQNRFFYEK